MFVRSHVPLRSIFIFLDRYVSEPEVGRVTRKLLGLKRLYHEQFMCMK